eukprot:4891364-Alexandrium_andersonii.AAC.1
MPLGWAAVGRGGAWVWRGSHSPRCQWLWLRLSAGAASKDQGQVARRVGTSAHAEMVCTAKLSCEDWCPQLPGVRAVRPAVPGSARP